MGYIPDEDKQITESLVPYLLQFAEEFDGLTEPDEGTLRILTRCIGTSFSLGKAYGRTCEDIPWKERLAEAFRIIRREGTL